MSGLQKLSYLQWSTGASLLPFQRLPPRDCKGWWDFLRITNMGRLHGSKLTWEQLAMVLVGRPMEGAQATSRTQSLWASNFCSSFHWPSSSSLAGEMGGRIQQAEPRRHSLTSSHPTPSPPQRLHRGGEATPSFWYHLLSQMIAFRKSQSAHEKGKFFTFFFFFNKGCLLTDWRQYSVGRRGKGDSVSGELRLSHGRQWIG